MTPPHCTRKLSRVGSINTDQIVAMREACLLENFEILHTYITLNYDGVHGVTFKSKNRLGETLYLGLRDSKGK